MNKFVNQNIQKMKSYNPPIENRRKYKGVLADFNEAPCMPTEVLEGIKGLITDDCVRLYPEYLNLVELVARYSGVEADQVMLTNGSDQGIDIIFRIFTGKNEKVIIPSPSFAMFYQCAQVMENRIIKPLYTKTFEFPLAKVLGKIDSETKLIVVCNPNNPTGTLVSLDNIEKILKKAFRFGAVVYVDEAYFEFSGVTAAGLISKYPNLIITRTFSKAFALCGLRIGYVLAQKEIIENMKKVRGPYDVNMIAAKAAILALKFLNKTKKMVAEIIESRKMLEDFLKEKKILFWPSSANFLLFKPKDSGRIFEELDEDGVRTRPRNDINIDGTIRITAGKINDMKKILKILKKII